MVALVLIAHFLVALIFSGYTDNWKLFDFWWGGGAVMCGALLFGRRPVRLHGLSFFLVPALFMLMTTRVFGGTAVHSCGWWLIALFLFILLPSLLASDQSSTVAAALFATLRWCGVVLALLYLTQILSDAPVRGIGLMRSAEAQILLGGLAGSLLSDGLSRPGRWVWGMLLSAGLVLNGSRSGLLGLGLILIAYLWIHHAARRLALTAGLAAAAAVLALTVVRAEVNPFAELRPKIFFLALNVFADYPGGSGLGTYFIETLSRNFPITDPRVLGQYAKVNNHAHNMVLQWAAEGGILGMATALAFLICSWELIRRCAARPGASWPQRSGLIWAPAFILELLINITETLSPIRWLGLVGIVALTADASVVLLRQSTPPFRLGVMLIGVLLAHTGLQDLFARQSLRAGIAEEWAGKLPEAVALYEESHRLRPWDEQPLLHLAQVAARSARAELVERSVEMAMARSENPAPVLYHGARMYRTLAGDTPGGRYFQKGRYLMLSMGDLQSCDPPRLLEAADWSRDEPERRWRARRVLQFEPRAARVYDLLAKDSRVTGQTDRFEKLTDLASDIRDFYGPGIRQGLAEFSIFNKNTARYDAWLLTRT